MGDTEVYRCGCGERIKECAFWGAVSQAMAKKGIAGFDITNARTSIYETGSDYVQRLLSPLHRGRLLEMIRDMALAVAPSWHRHLTEVQSRNAALVEVLQEIADARIVVDSSKSVLHLKYLLRIPSLELKVIQLIRDGRAVALSLIGHGLKRASQEETVAAAAREWRRSNESAECLLKRLPPSQWMRLRYEDFCREPEPHLRRICEFLGLDCRSLTLDFRSARQHIIGNSMRLGSEKQIRLDERWRTKLSKEDLRVFQSVAGEVNRTYGYES